MRPPPDKRERRPRQESGALDITRGDGDTAMIDAAAVIPPRPRHPSRQLEAWAAAVVHLHARALPAAVPELAAAWCRRRGVHPDWTTREAA